MTARVCKCGRWTTDLIWCTSCQQSFFIGNTKDDYLEEDEDLEEEYHILMSEGSEYEPPEDD